MKQAVLREASQFLDSVRDQRRAAGEVDDLAKSSIRRALEAWRAEKERELGQAFSHIAARFAEEISALQEETLALAAGLLEVELERGGTPTGITVASRFTYSFFEVPTLLESLLPDLRGYLPAGVARKLLLRRVRERVPEMVAKHCGRLRWDFVRRLEESVTRLEGELSGRLEVTVESLRRAMARALEQRTSSEERVLRARGVLAEERKALRELASRVERVLADAERYLAVGSRG